MVEKIIEFENVSFVYDADEDAAAEPALKNVDFYADKGEFLAVIGRNGSGKSTLAKLCVAIYEPTSGRVRAAGIVSEGEDAADKIRKKVGMVFQNPDNQIVAAVVEDDVAFGPENLGVEPHEIRRRVDEALRSVDMYDFRLASPCNLSGGQKQRVAIAGILAMKTECIIFDESTAMLDPAGRADVMRTAKRLNREAGITVVFITHFMNEAAQADRVVVMDAGKIVMNGKPREIFSRAEELRSYGMDVPQAFELCRRLGIKGGALGVDECVEKLVDALGGSV